LLSVPSTQSGNQKEEGKWEPKEERRGEKRENPLHFFGVLAGLIEKKGDRVGKKEKGRKRRDEISPILACLIFSRPQSMSGRSGGKGEGWKRRRKIRTPPRRKKRVKEVGLSRTLFSSFSHRDLCRRVGAPEGRRGVLVEIFLSFSPLRKRFQPEEAKKKKSDQKKKN